MKSINTKKIVALTTGLAMVGATIFGAAAQDLADYPSPMFIKDGTFSGKIVVGANAKTSDVLGSIEATAALQAASVTETEVVVGPGYSVIDKGVKIDKTGTHVGYNRFLQFVQDTSLDGTDLPTLLADGTFDEDEGDTSNKVDYTQEIDLFSTSGQLIFTQDDSDAPTAGAYLFFADNSDMYNYTLEFDEDVEYDNTSATTTDDDFNTAKLDILGKTYTITEVKTATGNVIDKITFLAGDTTRWMTQDEPLTREISGAKHTFVLLDVNENEDKCGISVDGTVQWIDRGTTKTIGGIEVGVTDAIVVHSAGKDTDVCEVNLGATELVLEDGNEVTLNGVDIDGSEVNIASTGGVLESLSIWYEPEDDVFLAAGDHFTEPVFDSFTFYFDGLSTSKTETIDLQASGDNADLTFMNNDGKEVKLEWNKNDSDLIHLGDGDDIDERTYLEGQGCNFVTEVTECEGAQFLVITSGGEAHMMELLDFDTADNKIKLKDVTYGSTSEDDFDETVVNTSQVIDLSSGAGAISLTISPTTTGSLVFTEVSGNSNIAETSLNDEGGLTFSGIAGNANLTGFTNAAIFTLTEESEDGYGANVLSFSIADDTGSDDDIDVNVPTATTGAFHASAVDASKDDDDHEWYVTNWSTEVYYDQEDDKFATVTYPEEYRYAQAFIGEAEAKISSAGGAVKTVVVNQIAVGSAALDRDITDVKAQNLLVVGGPCANTVAAELLGNPADCTAGFTDGMGIIQAWKYDNGNVALLAAGYSALDTRRVTRVLASYKDYAADLKGSKVVVKGTTLTDVTITAG
ncbi:S-layer protein [Candidatus Woesearchaeota archaeon]|nr:S-layer protein [Candidatus Woesearchaeota archaeon]